MKIVADSAIPFLQGILEPYARMEYIPGNRITATDVRDADALIVRTRTCCNEALLAGSNVRMIATATIGFDHIDRAWCRANGIHVATAAGCNARGVLQWIGAVMTHLSRTQGWHPTERTLGIVGVGHVGSLIRDYAAAWGFRICCCDPPREQHEHLGFLSLEQVATQSDLLTFHTPLDPTTHHMANAALFARMKPDAIVINSSRGQVVDTDALLNSRLRYVLDVWEHEPHINLPLLEGALLATPHIAGYSLQGKANATVLAVDSLCKFLNIPQNNWYPDGIKPSQPAKINWQELGCTIDKYFDIEQQSCVLKSKPGDFEFMRDNYSYREEYF